MESRRGRFEERRVGPAAVTPVGPKIIKILSGAVTRFPPRRPSESCAPCSARNRATTLERGSREVLAPRGGHQDEFRGTRVPLRLWVCTFGGHSSPAAAALALCEGLRRGALPAQVCIEELVGTRIPRLHQPVDGRRWRRPEAHVTRLVTRSGLVVAAAHAGLAPATADDDWPCS